MTRRFDWTSCWQWIPALGGAVALATGCYSGDPEPTGTLSLAAATSPVPARGTVTTLDLGTWNLEWFGDTANGPGDEALQLENVRDIIAGLDMDLWSTQEVTGEVHFANLVSQLSGHDGFLANDPFVIDGPAYYSDFDNNELKVGLIYKSATTTVHGARVILKENDYDFAGRPPVEVELTVNVDGTAVDLVMILLHAKAGSRGSDWDRRSAASAALKTYLDDTHPTAKVMVIGDFNDDVDQSIVKPKESPYKNFVDDAARYTFPTKALSDAGETSTVYYSDMIDHHLSTDELAANYQVGSVEVFPADQYVDSYDQTTSDHYPVLTRFTASGGGSNSPPTASFTYSCADLSCSFDAGGSSDSDGSIQSYEWNFGDGATESGAAVSHSYAASGTYSVTLTVTDDGGSSATASQDLTVGTSAGGIELATTGYKAKGQQKADLAWSGAGSTHVDVYRDGALIATTANDGAHTDHIDQVGGGSYTHQVCEAGTSICSNVTTIQF